MSIYMLCSYIKYLHIYNVVVLLQKNQAAVPANNANLHIIVCAWHRFPGQ